MRYLSVGGVFVDGGAQLEIAHQAMEIVGVDAQASCGVDDVSAGLIERVEDELLFEVANSVVIFGRCAAPGFGCFQNVLGRSSAKILSEEPTTTARSIAFSSSRMLPGQSY